MARAARFEFEVVDEVTSEEHQFRKALEEAPHDVLARCAYADWLAERGTATPRPPRTCSCRPVTSWPGSWWGRSLSLRATPPSGAGWTS
jgi:uncharacterized protein (TIGR02996 family)